MNCFRAGIRAKDIKLKRKTVRKHPSLIVKKKEKSKEAPKSHWLNKKNKKKIKKKTEIFTITKTIQRSFFRINLRIIPEVSRGNLAIRAMKKSIFIFFQLLLFFMILAYVSSQG